MLMETPHVGQGCERLAMMIDVEYEFDRNSSLGYVCMYAELYNKWDYY